MMKTKYFDLIKRALPEDIDPEEVWSIAPESLWETDSSEAAYQALARHPRINWEAYLAVNPDVGRAGINPIKHFVRDGIYEGRKLTSWHPLKEPDAPYIPLVSIIIAIFNNDSHLEKCLRSATGQTLKNIEIIPVNDASTDGSAEIIESFAQRDARVKPLHLRENGGIFMSRKMGTQAASGKYIMYMDGDDFLDAKACEVAYGEISKGYDIVEGGANIINTGLAAPKDAADFSAAINNTPERTYHYSAIAQAVFVSGGLVWPLWSKIYLRELALAGYNDLEDGYFLAGEDGYALLAIARLARNVKKIRFKWYNYNYGPGLSTLKDISSNYARCMRHGYAVKAMADYATKHAIDIGIDGMLSRHCKRALTNWLHGVPDQEADTYFEMIIDQFGLQLVLGTLLEHFQKDVEKFATKLQPRFKRLTVKKGNPGKVGIFCSKISENYLKDYVPQIMAFLRRRNMEAILFTEIEPGCLPNDLPEMNVVHLQHGGSHQGLEMHLDSLNQSLQADPIDLMLYMDGNLAYAFYDLLALAERGIPAVILYMQNFCYPFIYRLNPYRHHIQEAVYRCVGSVACFNRLSALFLQEQGVNAYYSGYLATVSDNIVPGKKYDLAFRGDLRDPNLQIGKALQILREVCREMPSVRMIFIGDLTDASLRAKFYSLAKQYGVGPNVRLTGKTEIPEYFLAQSRILLSTSYIDAFGYEITKAQALGLPCIAYDLPLEIFDDNESIIRIPQGEVLPAAKAALELLRNGEELRRLDIIARENAARFAPTLFFERLGKLINGDDTDCSQQLWTTRDYERVIKYAAWYSERNRPKETV